MYQLVASYAHPDNPEAFVEHYRTTHVPIARDFPKARSYTWILCESADGTQPAHFLIASVTWDTKDDALAALASPAGQAAVDDLAKFAGAGVEIALGEVTSEI